MTDAFGYRMFMAFWITFAALTVLAIWQHNPIAAVGAAWLTYLAGESAQRCRSNP